MRYSELAKSLKPSDTRELVKLATIPDLFNFASGLPASEMFPLEQMAKVDAEIYRTKGAQALQYGATEGYYPLREQIAAQMKKAFQVVCSAENVMLTTGSQQGLSLLGQLFLDKGDIVLVESPTYLCALSGLGTCFPQFMPVPTDEKGMIPEELDKILAANERVKMIYVIPDFQNPSGISWTLERRKQFMEVIDRYDVLVVEDDPYGELRYSGEVLPSLKSLDTKGNVAFLGSFSKILMPGLRVGWTVVDPDILDKMAKLKGAVDLQSSTFSQYQVSYFLDMFDLDEHIAKLRKLYGKRRDIICDAIERYFPEGCTTTQPDGGIFVWITLPEQLNAKAILPEMIENKITYVGGIPFYPDGGHENHMRFNFSSMPDERIEEGVKRAAEILKNHL